MARARLSSGDVWTIAPLTVDRASPYHDRDRGMSSADMKGAPRSSKVRGSAGALFALALLSGCAHQSAAVPSGATLVEVERLRAELADRDRIIAELESRIALLVA